MRVDGDKYMGMVMLSLLNASVFSMRSEARTLGENDENRGGIFKSLKDKFLKEKKRGWEIVYALDIQREVLRPAALALPILEGG